MSISPLMWDDNAESRIGPGISRARDGEKTRSFTVLVSIPGTRPMRWKIKAATAAKAKQYAMARWPTCTATIAQ
jgi:hypothetical protein